ncbi:MAG: iron-containing alcohol dehydrogenase [Thermogutta sp.]
MSRDHSLDLLPPFDFATARRVVFGWGRRRELPRYLTSLGRECFVLVGSRTLLQSGVADELAELVQAAGCTVADIAEIHREPQVADVDALTDRWRKSADLGDAVILALGGGAAIDLAKAVSARLTHPEGDSIRDYLEGVGRGLRLCRPCVPVVAVPTTAGTGTETTKNAVISSVDPPFKKSLRDDRILPALALVDAELTVSAPLRVTAYSGMDAITQLIESYCSRRRTPIPEALAESALRSALPSLRTLARDPSNRRAREVMAYAALVSGICLANSGLGMAHGIAASLGVHAGLPHGLACAMMLLPTLEFNRVTEAPRIAVLARRVLDLPSSLPLNEQVDRLLEALTGVLTELAIPRRLSEVGVRAEQLPAIAAGSFGSSMNGNPREASQDDILAVLEGIL